MVLLVLMVSTSLAVAFTVSPWLVPPYLVLMAWILAPARGSRSSADDLDRPEPCEAEIDTDRSPVEPAAAAGAPVADQAVPDGDALDPSPSTGSSAGSDPDPDPVAVKTRRGKGRGRKAKGVGAAIAEPSGSTATWIRVGPGKFVRVEGPVSGAPAEIVPATSEGETADFATPTLSAVEEPAEPASWELAAESLPVLEDRPAIADAPEPRDESVPDPTIAGEGSSPRDEEACPRHAPAETAWLDPDRASALARHPDENGAPVDVGACEESPALDEGEAIDDVGDGERDDHAEDTSEHLPAPSEWDDPKEGGLDDAPGDQGIALDALDVSRTAQDSEDLPDEEPDTACPSTPLARVTPSRPTDEAPPISWRASWPRVEHAAGSIPTGPRLGRAGRSGRESGTAPGFRRRSRRGAGRYRLVCRTFPPRSPPRSGRALFAF